jgi:hypothetical protein
MSTMQIDRRSLFRAVLGAGTLYGLDAAFTCPRTDAAQAGPKDNVKVTKIETFVLTNSWVFVKVSTDAGIVGWGEMLKDDAKACAAGALEVGRYLVGQDPSRVVHHWQAIHRGAFYKGGPIKTAPVDLRCASSERRVMRRDPWWKASARVSNVGSHVGRSGPLTLRRRLTAGRSARSRLQTGDTVAS